MNDDPARASVALAAVHGDFDSEHDWIPSVARGPATDVAGPAEQHTDVAASPGLPNGRTDLRALGRRAVDDRQAMFAREAERRTASIVEATDERHRVLLATIEASGALQDSMRQEVGKGQPVGTVESFLEPFTPARESEETLDLSDPVGVPSPGLVEALDDCAASLAWWHPDWSGAGVFGDRPRRRDRPRHVVANKIVLGCLLLALSGVVGWLVEVAVNAVAT